MKLSIPRILLLGPLFKVRPALLSMAISFLQCWLSFASFGSFGLETWLRTIGIQSVLQKESLQEIAVEQCLPGAEKNLLDVLDASMESLQKLLQAGKLSSVDLINGYLDQIEKHNTNGLNLRAIISVAPRELVVARARELDEERQRSGTRGKFHGIPIIIKV